MRPTAPGPVEGALALPNGPERSDSFSSAWWQLTGLAQLAEFHSGLSQPARDQLRAIDREAAQAVSSNRESSGTAQFADSIAATLADPTTSNWLKQSLNEALARDSVDAANDAQVLFELLAHRSEEELRAAALAAPALATACAMLLYAEWHGEWVEGRYGCWQWRWIKLIEAARECGVLEDGAHRSWPTLA